MESKKTEKFEMVSGLIVFFLGIGLLCFSFYLAFVTFIDPSKLSPFSELIPISVEEEYGSLVKVLVYLIAVLILWVIGNIGGRITKSGIEMYKVYKLKEKTLAEVSQRKK